MSYFNFIRFLSRSESGRSKRGCDEKYLLIYFSIEGFSEVFSLRGDRKLRKVDLPLPDSMFINGIAIPINDTSSCQNGELGKVT